MAQIGGFKNHNRTTSITSSSHAGENKLGFTTEEGVEFMLHELEPDSINFESGLSSRCSMKKRGRPRKDAMREAENFENNENNFNENESELSEEKLRKKREKRERKEHKEREKLKEICFENSIDSSAKKRGRPRKFKMMDDFSAPPPSDRLIDYHTSSNTDTLTPPYSELSEDSIVGKCSMMEMLNLDQELFPIDNGEQSFGLTDSFGFNYNWSPVQRMMQLNQALAFTNMYKDFIFWDRIIAEFMLPSVNFRLEFGTEKSFDCPFLVVSKLFWIFSQIGLHRIHFLHTGITEKLSETDEDCILFSSSDAFIYTHLYNDERLIIQHRTNQLIEFDSKSKISKWTIRFNKCEEFWRSKEEEKQSETEEFLWGFPKRVFDYLDVALVMNSVLPDPSSWLTWFYTFIHQNGLKNFSVVELSRPPSPFKFPVLTDEVMMQQDDNLGNMEFFDNGRDFIFSVLNSTTTEAINFDGTVDDLMTTQPPQPPEPQVIPEIENEAPIEDLFGKENEDLYPELEEYHEFMEEDVITPPKGVEQEHEHDQMHEQDHDQIQDQEHYGHEQDHVPEKSIISTQAPKPIDDSDSNEQLVVEISDTETMESQSSDSDDFFDSYN